MIVLPNGETRRRRRAKRFRELARLLWLEQGAGPIRIVAMYTVGTPYEAEAGRLIASLVDAGLPFYIEGIESAGDWDLAVAQKPFVLRRAMDRYRERLLFVDVDAWFHQDITTEAMAALDDHDFGAHWFQGPDGGYENRNDNVFLSGTMLWSRTERATALVDEWIMENRKTLMGGGQLNLARCFERVPGLRVNHLPGRWCRIFDKPAFYPPAEPTWIEHTIASRENKHGSAGQIDANRQARIADLTPTFSPAIVVAPNRGEFGLKCCYHVPAVAALSEPLVFHEPGEACLYPWADGLITVSPQADDERQGMRERSPAVGDSIRAITAGAWPSAQYVVTNHRLEKSHPALMVPPLSDPPDVVLCPRRRNYGSEKNWEHWPEIAAGLKAAGFNVFAAGNQETSTPTDCPAAWDHPNALEASIAAMQSARVVIVTDSGLAHLAVLCRAPKVLMIVEGADQVAPGSLQIKTERFRGAVDFLHHTWSKPAEVLARAIQALAS